MGKSKITITTYSTDELARLSNDELLRLVMECDKASKFMAEIKGALLSRTKVKEKVSTVCDGMNVTANHIFTDESFTVDPDKVKADPKWLDKYSKIRKSSEYMKITYSPAVTKEA